MIMKTAHIKLWAIIFNHKPCNFFFMQWTNFKPRVERARGSYKKMERVTERRGGGRERNSTMMTRETAWNTWKLFSRTIWQSLNTIFTQFSEWRWGYSATSFQEKCNSIRYQFFQSIPMFRDWNKEFVF